MTTDTTGALAPVADIETLKALRQRLRPAVHKNVLHRATFLLRSATDSPRVCVPVVKGSVTSFWI